jgi:hypothetical protein
MAKDLTIITDLMTMGGLLLFTGADAALDQGTIFELLSKFGVVAVLWYWLKDLKTQLKNQLQEFRNEAGEIRTHYDKMLEDKTKDFNTYQDRTDKLMQEILDKQK